MPAKSPENSRSDLQATAIVHQEASCLALDLTLEFNPAPQIGADPTDGRIAIAQPYTPTGAGTPGDAAVIDFGSRYAGFEFKGGEKGWLGDWLTDWLTEGKDKKPNLEALRIQPKVQPKLSARA